MIAELILAPNLPGDDGEDGQNIKSGAWRVARTLSGVGVKVREQVSVCAGVRDFQKAVITALGRSNIVVTLGGLGGESGDVAKTAVAKGLGLPLETNKACYQAIESYCKRTGSPFLPADGALARLPKGSLPIPGKHGKTPGILISSKTQHIVMLPESEREALSILADAVLPHIQGRAVPETSITRTLRTYGMSEEDVRRQLAGLTTSQNPAVSIHKEGNEVLIQVTGKGAGTEKAAAVCTPTLRKAAQLLGDSAYGLDVESLQAAVVDKLKNKHLGIAIAEAGSSGMLTRVLNETSGGADAVRYSVFVDDNGAKQDRLGISSRLLKKRGPVSEEAAVAIADAARKKSGAQLGVSLLMGGGQDRKSPHGLVYIAVCGQDCVYVKKLVIGSGDAGEKDQVLDVALSRALNMIRLFIDYFPKWYQAAIPLDEALNGRTVTDLASYDETESGTGYKKPSLFKRFLGNFIIRKADRPGVKVKKSVFILAMLVLVAASSYVGYLLWEEYRAQRLAGELQEMFTYGDVLESEIPPDFPRGLNTRFAALFARNEDVVAHISIPGTSINYPIVQADDNDFYLRRNFNRESTTHGIPFMDYRVNMRSQSDHMVVYGHNMQDGQLFADLLYFNVLDPNHGGRQALDFFADHSLIEFTSIFGDGTVPYQIFAVFLTNADTAHGPVFNYHDFIEPVSERDFNRFIDQLRVRSMIDTGVDVQPGDQLLTLSTCTYEFDDARFVVVARRLRRNESPTLDRSQISRNENPLMPNIWYQLFGGSPPENVSPNADVIPALTGSSSAAGLALLSFSPLGASQDPEPLAAVELPIETAPPPEPESYQPPPPPEEAPPAHAPPPEPEPAPQPAAEDAPEPPPPPANRNAPPADRSPSTTNYTGQLRVRADGREMVEDALYIVSRVVQIETGSDSFHPETIKAQAVAAYSFIRYYNDRGQAANVLLAPSATPRITNLVAEVLGEAVHFNGAVAFTPYHATSAGMTNSSRDVWGGHYPYLIPVESPTCRSAPGFERSHTLTYSEFARLLEDRLGILADGDPRNWLEVLTHTDGGYIGNVRVFGHTTSPRTGARLTGRMLRENVFGLRSASFTVEFDAGRDQFVFTTFGHGHGVGMSQNGANGLAQQGWSYIDILAHYFPGTQVF